METPGAAPASQSHPPGARRLLVSAAVIVLLDILAQRFVTAVRWLRLLDNVHWTVACGAAALVAWAGWHAAAPEERRERGWFLAGLAAYALGQLLWDVQVAIGWSPFPAPSDVFYLLLGPCLGIGLVHALRRRVPRERLRSATLDIVGLSTAALALTLAFYLPRRGDIGWLQMVVLVAYPVFLLGTTCIGIVLVLAARARFAAGWLVLLAGLGLNGFLWLRWNLLTIDNDTGDGTLTNAGFSIGALLQGWGALCWRIESAADDAWRRRCEQALRLLPVLLPVVAIGGAALARDLLGVPAVASWCVGIGAGVVLLASLLRQSLLNSELEQRVRARTAELAATNRELETFAYSVSHDLKAPLRGIDGFSCLLEQEHGARLPPEGQRYVTTIRRAAQQMSHLIEDLLEYSRIERRVLQPGPVDPGALVEVWRQERFVELQAAGAQLANELPALRLQADRQGLALALRNLLDNALKFSGRASSPAIAVAARETRGSWILSVRDNGIGFDMRYHDRIFEVFQRLNREEDYPGTGVGLAMVRRSAERMGGRAWAESAPGAGATFFLEIPK
jgi:signal transduction histidine kinase